MGRVDFPPRAGRKPLGDDVPALPNSDAHAQDGAGRAKVLVAEDHEDTRQMLRTLLEQRGLSVVEARDGLEAVEAAERERPNLILMDGSLPRLDGIAATRRLRGLPALSSVPIVFLSGHAGHEAQANALDAGCDEYVVKPFDLARIDTLLNRHLPERRGEQDEGVLQQMTQTVPSRQTSRQESKANRDGVPAQKLYGFFELDSADTVLYMRLEMDGARSFGLAPDYTGENFFTEVVPFRNVVEFRDHLDEFRQGSQPALSIDFTCDYEDGPLLVKMLLARIRERSEADVTRSILVHIRRV